MEVHPRHQDIIIQNYKLCPESSTGIAYRRPIGSRLPGQRAGRPMKGNKWYIHANGYPYLATTVKAFLQDC